MNRTKLPTWLFLAFAIPALLSIYSIYRRFQAETLNRATSFAMDYETIENLAASQGAPMDRAVQELKAQGLNSIVLSEQSVGDLIFRGRVAIASSYIPTGGASMDEASLRFTDPRDLARVQKGLAIRLQTLAGPLTARDNLLPLPPVSPGLVRATSIGLSPDQADVARRSGLVIIARCVNPPGVSSKTVEQTLGWAHEMGASVFLPEGEQVLGRRDSLQTTIDTLRSLGMLYASAEFAKIGGDENVVREAPEMVVRLHSAQAAELDKLGLADAVERYSKASRERNMRILLIRPFSYGADKPLGAMADFLHLIREQIVDQGGALGAPKPFGSPNLPRWYPVLIGLTIVPAAYFVGAAFFTGRRVRIAGGALLALLAIACMKPLGAQVMAFVATIVFPVAAFLVLDSTRPRNALLGFAAVTLISLIGGLCVAGMLNGLPYYVKAEEFSGVKVSIFLPILTVGFLFMDRMANLKDVFRGAITWGTAGLGLVILVVLGLMIARTGNDTGVGASGGETIFRNYLDRFLYVRPRTKEFLIGHPILVIGIGMLGYVTRRPARSPILGGWVALLLMVGSMGQTSIVNTLTHLHVPIALSLARIGLGAVIGSIIGFGLWAIVSRLLPTGEEA